ncbi:MAG TPA: ABC transporter ATP-binding protein [Candidatus Nanoarchaeia archaeon]|nr:ABC transporter ATP-binding protein [Candidatus Nanoarchaeia archaeon]
MLLTIKNLHAGYNELNVLKGINISLQPGEIIALIGPNGAGKSTVIKSIFNIANVTQGTITYKGENINKLHTYDLINLGISYVPQGKINFTNLTVEENLRIGTEKKDKDTLQKNLDYVYKKFPILKERRKQLAYGLSGGQQQMLALGRALMRNPDLLLLDEPSLGLSPKLQKELFTIIEQLRNDGIALFIVEQNAKKAIELADKTYLLEDGKIALEGGKDIINHKKIKNVYLGGRY